MVKTAGWAVIRDKTLNKEYDAAHMLSPMPLAITLGVGSTPIAYTMPAVENINGQAITLAIKHKDKRDPTAWKGFKFRSGAVMECPAFASAAAISCPRSDLRQSQWGFSKAKYRK